MQATCSCPTTWLPIAQFVATVFLGLGAFALAVRQWQTANERLKLDLFQKRFDLTEEVLKDINGIVQKGYGTSNVSTMIYDVKRARTLFGGETLAILDKLHKCGEEIIEYTSALEGASIDSPSFSAARGKQTEALNEISLLGPELQRVALRDMRVVVPSFLGKL